MFMVDYIYRSKEIIFNMTNRYKINISYTQVWHCSSCIASSWLVIKELLHHPNLLVKVLLHLTTNNGDMLQKELLEKVFWDIAISNTMKWLPYRGSPLRLLRVWYEEVNMCGKDIHIYEEALGIIGWNPCDLDLHT